MHDGSVLIIEDDTALRRSLQSTLKAFGLVVGDASTGETGLAELRQNSYDVVLLDLNMPGMGGMATCRKLRELYPTMPIIVLTVRDREEDTVLALDAGADDYVTKPFQLSDLAARIRAAVRRMRILASDGTPAVRVGDVAIDSVMYTVSKRNMELHLTPKEFALLHLLMLHAGRPLTHHRLLSAVWGAEYGNEREYLRTYISQLRKKIEDDPLHPAYILTESYVGYRFALP